MHRYSEGRVCVYCRVNTRALSIHAPCQYTRLVNTRGVKQELLFYFSAARGYPVPYSIHSSFLV
jgi:hypothetical protein